MTKKKIAYTSDPLVNGMDLVEQYVDAFFLYEQNWNPHQEEAIFETLDSLWEEMTDEQRRIASRRVLT